MPQLDRKQTFVLEDNASLAEALKALAHPSRLSIIKQLIERDRCCGGDFCACLSLSQSTISQHLDMLKQAGIVDWKQQGTRSIFTLNRDRLSELGRALTILAEKPHTSLDDPNKNHRDGYS